MESGTLSYERPSTGTAHVDRMVLERNLRALTRAAASLAAFCEHVEHNEANDVNDAVRAGTQLREIARDLAREAGVALSERYTDRIRRVEESSILRYAQLSLESTRLAGADAVEAASTWEELQRAQLLHDRQFHPDVFGLSKIDQIRHYTFHITKLAGLLADAIDSYGWPEFERDRLADLAIFGVKIATVCNSRLSEEPIDD